MKSFFLLLLIFIVTSAFLYSSSGRKVLLEEFSTAPCGFCPEGGLIAEELIKKYPDFITFTHHAGFGTDSMTIAESKIIAGIYTKFAPSAVIDRMHYSVPPFSYEDYLAVSRQKWDSLVAVRFNDPPLADVKIIEQDFSEIDRLLNAKVKLIFNEVSPDLDYRVNFAIVEDSVSGIGKGWDQTNYFNGNPSYPTLYKKGDPIVGYIHRHVLRALPTGVWGTASIFQEKPAADKEYFFELKNYKIPENWKTKDIKLISYLTVYDTSKFKHTVLNTDEVKLEINPAEVSDKLIINQSEIEILPNPVDELAYLKFNSKTDFRAEIDLISVNGFIIRQIAKGNFSENQNIYFYTSDLSNGLYFLRINLNNQIYLRKLIINRI